MVIFLEPTFTRASPLRYTCPHMTTTKLTDELTWRGFVNQTTYKDLSVLDGEPITFYLGVDPSADSMTVGNLAVVMMVRHFIEYGHKAILLVGGATGMIGDPDGKKQERDLLSLEDISRNKTAIAAQYEQVLGDLQFELVDNYNWFKDIGYLDFLRDIGKHVPMRTMLGRDFVQSRLGEEGAGISYAEFSYSLIQGYDFLHLHRTKGASLQVCGADQWGNSITGVDLIRRVAGSEAHVWSAPLVVNKATGAKFGKSEAGAVWLDANKTSPYDFYQFWLNVDDDGVSDYLKIYTFLSREEIESLLKEFDADRASRVAQKRLAHEVTKIVHGEQVANDVLQVTERLFGKAQLSDDDYKVIKSVFFRQALTSTSTVMTSLVEFGLASSNTEARRFIQEGAIRVNDERVSEPREFRDSDFHEGIVVLRRGKNQVVVAERS